jgi:hypothetical protein
VQSGGGVRIKNRRQMMTALEQLTRVKKFRIIGQRISPPRAIDPDDYGQTPWLSQGSTVDGKYVVEDSSISV